MMYGWKLEEWVAGCNANGFVGQLENSCCNNSDSKPVRKSKQWQGWNFFELKGAARLVWD